MFENLLYQNVALNLASDIKNGMLPNSLLFSGPEYSGKLTCALELARILSCQAECEKKGDWNCTCPSCKKHKELTTSDILIAGPRDCFLEIAASKDTFLQALKNNSPYIKSSNYLFVRSVRKLTARFNPIFYENDDNAKKISPYLQAIDESLETLDPSYIEKVRKETILDIDKIQKQLDELFSQCQKLESSFMPGSVPISHIRNASTWAQYTTVAGKKVLIIENADRMNDSSRNALLKILEEPPKDMVFILTTTKKNAIMPTILSRVRNFSFTERTLEQQTQVVSRVFHSSENVKVSDFLENYLPVEKTEIEKLAENFLDSINRGELLKIDSIIKAANDFKPRILFRIFMQSLFDNGRKKIRFENCERKNILYAEKQQLLLDEVNRCYENVMIYNQTPASSLETLVGALIR